MYTFDFFYQIIGGLEISFVYNITLQLPETCHVVHPRYSCWKILGQSSCSIIGSIYSQGWQLNVNKLSSVNASTLKTDKYHGN